MNNKVVQGCRVCRRWRAQTVDNENNSSAGCRARRRCCAQRVDNGNNSSAGCRACERCCAQRVDNNNNSSAGCHACRRCRAQRVDGDNNSRAGCAAPVKDGALKADDGQHVHEVEHALEGRRGVQHTHHVLDIADHHACSRMHATQLSAGSCASPSGSVEGPHAQILLPESKLALRWHLQLSIFCSVKEPFAGWQATN